jgi:hypothetical protein
MDGFLVPVVFLVAGIAGCASTPQPYTYHDDRDEKPGPGLFSGEKGGYIIYGEPPAQAEDPGKKTTDSD